MVIFKLGGSLLTLPDLAARLETVLAQRDDCRCALVVGGGVAADLVREWDRTHRLGDEAAHQLALRAMRLTAEFVATLLPSARIVEDRASLTSAWASGRLPILAADAWPNVAVPHSWDATSDTIAAWFAAELSASELVLLKSVPPPSGNASDAARAGDVDLCFPNASARVPQVSWVNLRGEHCMIEPWIPR